MASSSVIKNPALLIENGAFVSQSIFPPAWLYGMELLKLPFTCEALLSQFPFGIYYVTEIFQPNAFRKKPTAIHYDFS